MQTKNTSSWVQLGLFTGFLFLLVAIPYTVFLKATSPQKTVHIANLPSTKSTTPPPSVITPPPPSTTTACITVGNTYTPPVEATPSSYLIQDTQKHVCFPPALPPFPFTWDVYKDYQHGFTFDIPSNWIAKTVSQNGIVMHNFYQETPTATTAADLSFGWYQGQDPFASNAAYIKASVTKGPMQITVYTKGPSQIQAVFPDESGYLLLQATTQDAAFYAFQHMLTSLIITQ